MKQPMTPEEAESILQHATRREVDQIERIIGYRTRLYPPEGVSYGELLRATHVCDILRVGKVPPDTDEEGIGFILLNQRHLEKLDTLIDSLADIADTLNYPIDIDLSFLD